MGGMMGGMGLQLGCRIITHPYGWNGSPESNFNLTKRNFPIDTLSVPTHAFIRPHQSTSGDACMRVRRRHLANEAQVNSQHTNWFIDCRLQNGLPMPATGSLWLCEPNDYDYWMRNWVCEQFQRRTNLWDQCARAHRHQQSLSAQPQITNSTIVEDNWICKYCKYK